MTGSHTLTCYLQVEPRWQQSSGGPRVTHLHAAGVTNREPSSLRGGRAIKVTVTIPDAAFLPLAIPAMTITEDGVAPSAIATLAVAE